MSQLQKSQPKKRGIALVSVLFFAVLIAVFVAAALVLGPASLARAAADSGGQAADQAAKAASIGPAVALAPTPTGTRPPRKR